MRSSSWAGGGGGGEVWDNEEVWDRITMLSLIETRVRSPSLVCIRMDPRSYWSNPRSVLVKIMLAGVFGFHWKMFLINYVICVPARLLCGSNKGRIIIFLEGGGGGGGG